MFNLDLEMCDPQGNESTQTCNYISKFKITSLYKNIGSAPFCTYLIAPIHPKTLKSDSDNFHFLKAERKNQIYVKEKRVLALALHILI